MSPRYAGGMYQQQSAKLQMTRQMRQALHILHLSAPDLWEVARKELEENPFLEWSGSSVPGQGFDPGSVGAAVDPTLESHLMEQLRFTSGIAGSMRRMVSYLIGNLDPNGYLEITSAQAAQSLRATAEETEAALLVLQSFDPAGVGARDLRECLLLQAYRWPQCPPLALSIIRCHLDDVASHRFRKLSRTLQAPPSDIEEAVNAIRKLNPRPGAAFEPAHIRYTVPDVRIEKDGDGFLVTIPDAASPRLSINGQYEPLIRGAANKDEERMFLQERWRSGIFLIKCLNQRRLTLWRVTTAIVEEQLDFFREGVSRLKPMVLRQIADKLGLHESTVSRATAGKYAQTPWGVFELPFFFPSGFHQGQQQSASAESVKQRIKQWVNTEDGRKPYSDQKLADLLAAEGIPVARRTVAKYREQLGISPSVARKRTSY